MVLIGERSLRLAVGKFSSSIMARNHQALENKIMEAEFTSTSAGRMEFRERLGRMLRYYCRETG